MPFLGSPLLTVLRVLFVSPIVLARDLVHYPSLLILWSTHHTEYIFLFTFFLFRFTFFLFPFFLFRFTFFLFPFFLFRFTFFLFPFFLFRLTFFLFPFFLFRFTFFFFPFFPITMFLFVIYDTCLCPATLLQSKRPHWVDFYNLLCNNLQEYTEC